MSETPAVPIRGMLPASANAEPPAGEGAAPPAEPTRPPPAPPAPPTYRRLCIAELHAELEDFRAYLAAGIRGVLAHALGYDGELSRLVQVTKTGRLMVDLAAGSDHADSAWPATVATALAAGNTWLESIDARLLAIEESTANMEGWLYDVWGILNSVYTPAGPYLEVHDNP